MGRLLARVREAEEKLAGLTQALQSAWEEELADARQALEAAAVAVRRAEAMDEAARALGREELASRLREVLETLRSSESSARTRMAELRALEATVGARLEAAREAPLLPEPDISAERTPPPVAARPIEGTAHEVTPPIDTGPRAPPSAVTVPLEREPAPSPRVTSEGGPRAPQPVATEPVEDLVEVTAEPVLPAEPEGAAAEGHPRTEPAAPAPTAAADSNEALRDLLQKQSALAVRIGEVARALPKLPRTEAELALKEHVALVRLLADRFSQAGDPEPATRTAPLLARLADLARDSRVGTVFGLSASEFADWNRAANEARARRQALAAARRKGASRP